MTRRVLAEATKILPVETNDEISKKATLLEVGLEVGKSVFGHYLHTFLSPVEIADASKRWANAKTLASTPDKSTSNEKDQKSAQKKVDDVRDKKADEKVKANSALAWLVLAAAGVNVKDNKAMTQKAIDLLRTFPVAVDDTNLYLLAIQLVETEKADQQNKLAAAGEAARLKEGVAVLEAQKVKEAEGDFGDDMVKGFMSFFGMSRDKAADASKEQQEKYEKEMAKLRGTLEKLCFSSGMITDGDNAAFAGVGAIATRNGLDFTSGKVPSGTEEFGQKENRQVSGPSYAKEAQNRYFAQGNNPSVQRNASAASRASWE